MTSRSTSDTDAAFEQLFRDYQRPILNYVYRLTGDGALAEDLTQQAFVKAYQALPRLPLDANRRAWLYRIATNLAYDQLRRQRILQWLPLRSRHGSSLHREHAESQTEQEDAVVRTLEKLGPRERAVLVLYSVQGYSTAEIGEMLDMSQGAVKTCLFRARERFRQAYEEER